MKTNYIRPIICFGNDFTLKIELQQFVDSELIDFDLTKVKSLEVYLVCAVHNQKIPLEYEIEDGHNNILSCFVDWRTTHQNTSYGVCVEGNYEDDTHFRWYMQPKEGILVVNNSSGQNIPQNVEVVDLHGRVGFNLPTGGGGDLTNYYTKSETNDLLDEKQDELESGVNIKTINNQSLLGSGNITIGGGGTFTQEQADWAQTDNSKVDYIKNKPTLFSGDYNDLTNKPDLSVYAETSDLATVATTGDYDDLSNKPDLSVYTTQADLANKQDTLVSGTNIKTINNQSLLGSGNIAIEGGGTQVQANWNETDTSDPSYIQNKPDLSIYAETSDLATVATTGDYDDLSNKPTLFSGNYNDLTNKPDLSVYAETSDLATVATTGDYDDLSNKPTLFSGNYNDLTNKPDLSIYAESSDLATVATTGNYNDLSNKPDLSVYATQGELTGYATKEELTGYATQADLETKQDQLESGVNIKTINNESILGSGNITIEGGTDQVNSDWNSTTGVSMILNKPDLSVYAESSDLATVATTGNYNDLSNKPTIPTTTSELTNDSGFLTYAVTSFNGATGTVTYTAPVTSVNGQTGAVVIETGEHDYSKDYLTFEALENTTFKFTKRGSGNNIQYSLDNGTTWTDLASNTASPTVNKGSTIMWKCYRTAGSSGIGTFSSTGKFNACGNVSSIIHANNFVNFGNNPDFANSLQQLFNECTTLINTENLYIPFTTLWGFDCYEMFKNCTNLVTAPKILPATKLQQGCYWNMFYGCTSLIKAPELPATTLVSSCYRDMFHDCTSLNYIKCLATDISATNCTTWWVYHVASKGLFIPANNSVAWPTGNNGIPASWTKGTDADNTYVHKYELATVATSGSYNDLTNKPDLSIYATHAELTGYATKTDLETKQDTLVSGTNIKTINEQSLLGTGNITIEGGSSESEKVIAEALYKHENEIKGTASRIDTISTDLDSKIETAINEINTKIDTVVDDLVPDINASNRTIAEVVTNIHNKQPIVLEYGQDIPNDVFEDIRNGRRPAVLHVSGGQFPTTSSDTPDYYISDYTVGKSIYEPWIQFNYTLEFFQNYMGVRPAGRQLKVTFRYVATNATNKWEKTTHSIVTSPDILFIKQVTEMPQTPDDYTLYIVVPNS